MGLLYITLVHHRILERSIHTLVAQELLYLLNGHTLINSHGRQSAAEFVRMNFVQVQFFTQAAKTNFDTADLQTVIGPLQRNKECRIIIFPAVQISLKVDLGPGIEINLSLFIAFTQNNTLSVGEINIAAIQLYQFANTHPSRCQHINNGQITYTFAVIAH